jgi:hypothetical protein
MHVYYFAIAGGQLVTDEIGLNQAVGEAAGWITEKTMGGAIGFVLCTIGESLHSDSTWGSCLCRRMNLRTRRGHCTSGRRATNETPHARLWIENYPAAQAMVHESKKANG